MFLKYPHLLTRVGRNYSVHDAEKFACLLYGIEEKLVKDIDDTRHSVFVKTKRDLEILPHNKLELHIDHKGKLSS